MSKELTTKAETNVTPVSAEDSGITPTRRFEDLPEEEKKIVEGLMAKLVDYSDKSLIDFSSDSASKSAKEAEDFLRNTKMNDLEEFKECMGSLTKDLRSIDTKELSKRDPNPLSRIPVIGPALAKSKAGKKVESVIQKQVTVKKSIDMTVSTIEGIKLTLREDLIRCGKTREATIEFAKNLEYEYIALYQKRQELEAEYQRFTTSPEYNPINLDDTEYAEGIQNAIQQIERKMDALLRYRINAIHDIPSLALVQASENAIINHIEDCIRNVIPEWDKAFLKAILAYRVANAADVMTSINNATNAILLSSTEMTAKAIIGAAEVIEAPSIATETLQKQTEIFIDTCNKLVEIAQNASQRRIEDAEKLKEEEKKSILSSTQRKTIPVIPEESEEVS